MSSMECQDILKKSVMGMYRNKPEFLPLLDQVDFTALTTKYYEVLYQHIDEETFSSVDKFMLSEEAIRYSEAVQNATLVVVNGLEDMLQFVEQTKPIQEKYN